MERRRQFYSVVVAGALILALCKLAQAQYGGGSGTADDPYLIYTPEQMNAIGADPNDWDQHFQLMADIDLSQYTGTEFNLIGSAFPTGRGDTRLEQAFSGTFDGDGHTISNFTYTSDDEGYIGLFRAISDPNAEIRNLGIVTARIDAGGGGSVGALVGYLEYAAVTNCFVEDGMVTGDNGVGGLIGSIRGGGARGHFDLQDAAVRDCHSTCDVSGASSVGGLVGSGGDLIADSYSTGMVTGEDRVGGLAGSGYVLQGCYADGIVIGNDYVGGLAGDGGAIMDCYAQAAVSGNRYVGGLAGGAGSVVNCYASGAVLADRDAGGLVGDADADDVVASFWDFQAGRQQTSMGGEGKTTAQMQTLITFRAWGQGDSAGAWTIDEGNDYPRLAWEQRPGIVIEAMEFADLLHGGGTANDPYLIYTIDELELVTDDPNEWDKHYRLMADIDLSAHPGVAFNAGWSSGSDNSYPFSGVFDGNGHVISNFTYFPQEARFPAFFGYVQKAWCPSRRRNEPPPNCDPNATPGIIKNLGLLNPIVGPLGTAALAEVLSGGTVANCYVEGGLVLGSSGTVAGLVAYNTGTVTQCYASGMTVIGGWETGGLIGHNAGDMMNCYSINTVIGGEDIEDWHPEGAGGLLGGNSGRITNCYSASTVTGAGSVGGLIGVHERGTTTSSFWDIEASGLTTSAGGTGLTTAEMMTAATFLEAGWDFVGEVENGTEEIWWIDEGVDYPRLWWEAAAAEF